MPIQYPVSNAAYGPALDWVRKTMRAGSGPSVPEDQQTLSDMLLKLAVPGSAKEAVMGGVPMPGYLASSFYDPNAKTLKIGLFESEKPTDILKLLKDVAGAVKKHGIERVIGSSPLHDNPFGGAPMYDILKGAGGRPSHFSGDLELTGQQIVDIASSKERMKAIVDMIRERAPRNPARVTPMSDRQAEGPIFSYGNRSSSETRSIPKQIEKDIEMFSGFNDSSIRYVDPEIVDTSDLERVLASGESQLARIDELGSRMNTALRGLPSHYNTTYTEDQMSPIMELFNEIRQNPLLQGRNVSTAFNEATMNMSVRSAINLRRMLRQQGLLQE